MILPDEKELAHDKRVGQAAAQLVERLGRLERGDGAINEDLLLEVLDGRAQEALVRP